MKSPGLPLGFAASVLAASFTITSVPAGAAGVSNAGAGTIGRINKLSRVSPRIYLAQFARPDEFIGMDSLSPKGQPLTNPKAPAESEAPPLRRDRGEAPPETDRRDPPVVQDGGGRDGGRGRGNRDGSTDAPPVTEPANNPPPFERFQPRDRKRQPDVVVPDIIPDSGSAKRFDAEGGGRDRLRDDRPRDARPIERPPVTAPVTEPSGRSDRDRGRDGEAFRDRDRPRDARPIERPPVTAPVAEPSGRRDRDRGRDGEVFRDRDRPRDARPVFPGLDAAFDARRRARVDEAQGRRRDWLNESGRVQGFDDLRRKRSERRADDGRTVVIEEPGNRRIFRDGNRAFIRHDETDRFRRSFRDVRTERRGDTRTTIALGPGGVQIITEQDNDGRLLRRYRRYKDGREAILIDNRWDRERRGRRERRGGLFDFTLNLAPPVVRIPRDRYIVDYEEASDQLIYDTLSAPPVQTIDEAYTLDEVRYNASLRDRMRRVDLDAITFAFGSWEVAEREYDRLQSMADAMLRVINRNESEIFLIEGHTDAVGRDDDNLSLSDRRAESVAAILTEEFGVPAENLTTQGYGEQYLKVPTDGPERLNRRVAVRRITPLISQRR